MMEAHRAAVEDAWHAAAEALGQIGPAAAEAVPALATTLGSAKTGKVRRAAAETLGRIGPAAAEAVPALIAALSHYFGNGEKDPYSASAEALGLIGPAAVEAVPALITVLSGWNRAVRFDDWTLSYDEDERRAAAGALGRIGAAKAEVVRALATALSSDRKRRGKFAVPLPRRSGGSGLRRRRRCRSYSLHTTMLSGTSGEPRSMPSSGSDRKNEKVAGTLPPARLLTGRSTRESGRDSAATTLTARQCPPCRVPDELKEPVAAVDMQNLAGDEASIGQINARVGNLLDV